jgi:cytidine deaminase
MMEDLQTKLIDLAKKAQEKSYSPYSKFAVGAALMTQDGSIFTGCNVENISYGLTSCGERNTIFKMISEKGPNAKIKALALSTKADIPCSPCGACRQVILEFSTPETLVFFKGKSGYVSYAVKDLLPGAFMEFEAVGHDGSSTTIQSGM